MKDCLKGGWLSKVCCRWIAVAASVPQPSTFQPEDHVFEFFVRHCLIGPYGDYC